MIELRDLAKAYRPDGPPAVSGLNLSVPSGEFLVLTGPSGCGKTTTLSMINRLVDPSAGAVLVDGVDTRNGDPAVLRRHIGFVFQDIGLFPHMTVGENVSITPRLLGWPREKIAERTADVLELVRLPGEEYRHRLPAALSGGQRQRVGLARALASEPKIMLMDEPFGAIDPLLRDELGSDYRAIHDRLKLTTVLVTHDMTEAMMLADRIAIMREGRLVQVGTPRELSGAPVDDFVRAMIETPRRRAKKLAEALSGAA
jgi:osmoprotectant transport system ATP-binding protein